jgi:hypothetical protein
MSDLEDNSWPAFRLDSEITFQLASELDFPSKKGDNGEQRWFCGYDIGYGGGKRPGWHGSRLIAMKAMAGVTTIQ